MNTKDRYFIYARKSSETEDRQVASVDSQIEELDKTVVTRLSLKNVEIYQEAQSAKAPGRPIFNEMMARVANGEVKAIICWKLNRLARNPVDGGQVIWAVNTLGVEVLTPSKTYTKRDLILMYVELGIANQFINDLSEDSKRGLKHKAESGWLPSGAKPGYANDKYAPKGSKTIVKDEVRFPLIKKAWGLMLSGTYNPPKILEILNNDWGYRTIQRNKLGGKPMARSQIYDVFTDPFYYGEFEYPVNSGNWYHGKHEPMITKEEFDRVQILLGRKGKPKLTTREFFATGVIRCGECQASITAEEKFQVICSVCKTKFASLHRDACPKCNTLIENMKNPKILHYIYYHCTKRKNPNCTQGSITESDLKEQVDKSLSSIQISEEFKDWAIKYLNEVNDSEVKDRNAILGSLQGSYGDVVRRIDNLVRLKINPNNTNGELLSDVEFKSQKDSLMKEKTDIEVKLKESGERISRWVELTEKTFNFACYAKYWFANGDMNQRRQILQGLGSNLTLIDKNVLVNLDEPLEYIESARQEVAEISPEFEPEEKGYTTTQLGAYYSQNPSLLPG